jgi:hypothetical protein
MSKKPQPFKGQYEQMDFPDYQFREFPKMMLDEDGNPHKDDNGNPVVVNSQKEELQFLAGGAKVALTPSKAASDIENLKAELAAKDAELVALREASAPKPPVTPPVPIVEPKPAKA